jgi:hypothetical protein
MRYRGLLAAALVVLTCCNRGTAYLVDGGGDASGGSTAMGGSGSAAAGMSTAAAGSGTTGGTGSNTGGTQGSTSAGTAGTSSSSGGSTGIGPPPCVWVNDVCALATCTNAWIGAPCILSDGGLGGCHGGQCADVNFQDDPDNCGWYGVRCPPGVACANQICVGSNCFDGGGCPNGYICQPTGCIAVDCTVAADDDSCISTAGNDYFCCGGSCVYSSAANCGGCNVTCPPTTACLNERCTPVNTCSTNVPLFSSYMGATCLLPSGDAGQCCGGMCVDTSQSDHCDSCSHACAAGSSCVASGYGYASCFGDGCGTDADCPQGFGCFGGGCELVDCTSATEGSGCVTAVNGGGVCCGGQCVDSYESATNCGGCGISCVAGQNCLSGSCVELAPSASETAAYCRLDDGGLGFVCSGMCTDVASDPVNCGSCSVGCPNGATCDGGVCLDDAGALVHCTIGSDCPAGTLCNSHGCSPPTCGSGNRYCSGDGGGSCCGAACVDTDTDPENCGGCAITCPVALGSTCHNGGCVWPDGGALDCNVDGASCSGGFQCGGVGPGCVPPTCELGQARCAFAGLTPGLGTCCGDVCVDTGSDPLNCLGCGIECPSGYCDNGLGSCLPSPLSQGCAASCGSGTICAQGWCVDSRCDSLASAPYCLAEDGAAGLCCFLQNSLDPGSACADPSNDPLNCGTCGLVCPAGATCVNGLCNGLAACGPGHAGSYCDIDAGLSFLCCPGLGCIDTSSDPQNCGACNSSCGIGQTCDAGQCGPS